MTDQPSTALTFKEALQLGKYQPEFLAQFPEWQNFDRQIQYQYIALAIQNRRKQLRLQWANINNQLDFSKKPYLKDAVKKVEQAIHDLNEDEEKLLVEYAGS